MLARVVFVDDDPVMLSAVSRLLRLRFAVVATPDPRRALAAFDSGDIFQLAIADFDMPGMNGLEFLSAVALKSPSTARLLLTGAFGSGPPPVEPGVCRLVSKQCSVEALLRAILEAVSGQA